MHPHTTRLQQPSSTVSTCTQTISKQPDSVFYSAAESVRREFINQLEPECRTLLAYVERMGESRLDRSTTGRALDFTQVRLTVSALWLLGADLIIDILGHGPALLAVRSCIDPEIEREMSSMSYAGDRRAAGVAAQLQTSQEQQPLFNAPLPKGGGR